MKIESTEVYIVYGETGEYSDWRVWNVKAFLDKADAESFCATLNAWLYDNGCLIPPDDALGDFPGYCAPELTREGVPPNPHDPAFYCDGGTLYKVIAVPLQSKILFPTEE